MRHSPRCGVCLSDRRHRFRIGLSRLRWVANYENNRWFLVLQAQKPPGNELNSLLRASNGTARRYGQPRLYQSQQTSKACDQVGGNRGRARFSKNRKTGQSHARIHIPAEADEDATDQFHISIGWTLETPGEIPLNAADVVDGGDAPSRPELSVQTVKARIGNGVVAIALAAKAVDSNGIVGV